MWDGSERGQDYRKRKIDKMKMEGDGRKLGWMGQKCSDSKGSEMT